MNYSFDTVNAPPKRACICMTPLHVLIVERIAQTLGLQFDEGFYLSALPDARQQRYLARMKGFCTNAKTIQQARPSLGTGFKKYVQLWQYRRQVVNEAQALGQFDEVFSACGIDDFLWATLTGLNPKRVYTYDDGLLNIQGDSIHWNKSNSWLRRAFLKACGVHFNSDNLPTLSVQHFTIYPGKNWFERTLYIPLLGTSKDGHVDVHSAPSSDHSIDAITLFVGPAPEQMRTQHSVVRAFLDEHPGCGFIPHPRDKLSNFPGCERINTELIVEEYVMDLLASHPQRHIQLFGTESSSLVNLAKVGGVTATTVLPGTPENLATIELMVNNGVVWAPIQTENTAVT